MRACGRGSSRPRAGQARRAARPRRRDVPAHGRHVQRLRPRGRLREDLPVRPDPARHRCGHVGESRSRLDAAGAGAERVHPGRLRRGRDPQGRRRSARSRARLSAVPARGRRRDAAARDVRHRGGHRSRARRGRALLRARGQRAHAVGRVVRHPESRRDDAPAAGPRSRERRAQRRELSRGPAREPVRARAGRQVASQGRAAHARHLQLGVLRARLPVAPDGHRPRRGTRPRVRRSQGLHEDGARSRADRRPLPPHRRRLPRSGRVPPGLAARRRGHHRRDPRGQRLGRERDRHGHRRRQGDLRLHAGDRALLPERGAAAADRRDAHPERSRRPAHGAA